MSKRVSAFVALIGVALIFVPVIYAELTTLPEPPPHAELFKVTVTDRDTGQGILNAKVTMSVAKEYDPYIYVTKLWFTDENGVVESYLVTPIYDIIFAVDAEGYTSDKSKYEHSYYDDGGLIPETVELYLGEPEPFPWDSIGDLTIEVVDEKGNGISNASVYLFEGSSNEQLDLNQTNSSGIAVFEELSGFYDVGVVAEGYTSGRATDEYSYYGSVGVGQDIAYRIELSPVGADLVLVQFAGAGLAVVGGVSYANEVYKERKGKGRKRR